MSYKRLIAGLLFILTAVLHFVQPFIYGINFSTIGYTVFGVIYLSLGTLVMNKKLWTLRLSIIMPVIGILLSLFDYFTSQVRPTIYPFLVLIDVVIIVLSISELNNINKTDRSIT